MKPVLKPIHKTSSFCLNEVNVSIGEEQITFETHIVGNDQVVAAIKLCSETIIVLFSFSQKCDVTTYYLAVIV